MLRTSWWINFNTGIIFAPHATVNISSAVSVVCEYPPSQVKLFHKPVQTERDCDSLWSRTCSLYGWLAQTSLQQLYYGASGPILIKVRASVLGCWLDMASLLVRNQLMIHFWPVCDVTIGQKFSENISPTYKQRERSRASDVLVLNTPSPTGQCQLVYGSRTMWALETMCGLSMAANVK